MAYGNRPPITPPVNVGDEIEVRIEAVGEKGDGIAKEKGFVLFVPNTKEGEEVKIRITKVLRKVGFAEVVGPAEGPISTPEQPARPVEADNVPEAEPEEPAAEDTEDFGEEAPAEEPVEEVPVPEEPVEEEEAPAPEEAEPSEEVPAPEEEKQ